MLQSLLCSQKAHPTEETRVASDGGGEGKVNPEKRRRNICCAGVDWCTMSWPRHGVLQYKVWQGWRNCEVKHFIMDDVV